MATKVQPILPSAVKRAEHGRMVYSATLADGVGLSDVQKSEYWVHLANRLEQWDRIEVVPEDGSFFAEYLVARIEKLQDGQRTVRIPKLALLNHVEISTSKAKMPAKPDADDDLPDGYRVEYSSPKYKWRVIQEGVSEPLAQGLSKDEAIAWANEHAAKSGE